MLTLPTTGTIDRKNYHRTKECIESMLLISHDNNQFRISIKAQWFKAHRADGIAPLYCTVQYWSNPDENGNSIYTESNAHASGFGYNKQGAVFGHTLLNAGFILSDNNICYGGGDIRTTLEEIAQALNLSNFMVLTV